MRTIVELRQKLKRKGHEVRWFNDKQQLRVDSDIDIWSNWQKGITMRVKKDYWYSLEPFMVMDIIEGREEYPRHRWKRKSYNESLR